MQTNVETCKKCTFHILDKPTHKDYERYKQFVGKFNLSPTEYNRKLKKWCERHEV